MAPCQVGTEAGAVRARAASQERGIRRVSERTTTGKAGVCAPREYKMAEPQRWRPVLLDCPRTGEKVQGMIAEQVLGASETRYESVSCLACSGIHFIDPVQGSVLGAKSGK